MKGLPHPFPEFYREHFIFVAALPKSASSLIWLFVSALQEPDGRANPARQREELPSPFLPLQRELLQKNFPEGGVYKSHSPLTFDTADFLEWVENKYVISLRHPADYVAALYCHMRGIEMRKATEGTEVSGSTSTWTYALSPMKRNMFRASISPDVAIGHMLNVGCLFSALEWMSHWLAFRNKSRSFVVKYEDVFTNFDETVEKLSRFVRGSSARVDIMAYLREVTAAVAAEGAGKDSNQYPRGWTGRIGVYKEYFSRDNRRAYRDVVEKFFACHPQGPLLLEFYPDLKSLE